MMNTTTPRPRGRIITWRFVCADCEQTVTRRASEHEFQVRCELCERQREAGLAELATDDPHAATDLGWLPREAA